MNPLKRFFSFFIPFTTKIESEYSGTVELTTSKGKKVLDTANANYSYGSLQRILRGGLGRIDLGNVNSILLLGVAGGSVIETLREVFKFEGEITGIELDPVMLQIADKHYFIRSEENTKLIQADAFEYVRNCREKYDLVIVDLFIDNTMPDEVYALDFWKFIRSITKRAVLWNTISETAMDTANITKKMHKSGWRVEAAKQVEQTNDLYVFTK